jgi:cobalt-zinc-cadmium efflux system outer membrane protein
MHHRTPFLLLVLLSPATLLAQEGGLTLRMAREAARSNNPGLRAARALALEAHADTRTRGALANPVASIGTESVGGGPDDGSELMIALEQPLDLWGGRPARSRAAALRADAADVRVAVSEAWLDEEVAVAFAESIAASRKVTASDRLLVALDRALGILAERRAAGDASGLDLRRIQLERTRAMARSAGARHVRHSAIGRLAALMAAPPGSLDTLELVMDSTPEFSPDLSVDSLRRAVRRAPSEALALELDARAAAADITAASRARLPVPTLRLGGKWTSPPGGGSRQHGLVAGVAFPLPVWNGGTGAVDVAIAAEAGAQARSEAAGRDLDVAWTEAWEGLADHAPPFAQLTSELAANGPAIREAIEVAFAEGELSVTEWLDALRTEHETTILHGELWLDLVGRLARLERLTHLTLVPETR